LEEVDEEAALTPPKCTLSTVWDGCKGQEKEKAGKGFPMARSFRGLPISMGFSQSQFRILAGWELLRITKVPVKL